MPCDSDRLILVTESQYIKGETVFTRTPKGWVCCGAPAEETMLAKACRREKPFAVIVGVEPYRGPLYESLPRGGVIARFGVGHDGIDKALATRFGLFCTNTPGVLEDSVAEHTLGLLLTAVRGIARADEALRRGEWISSGGLELRGKTLAVIGCGRIGSRVARMASAGFGMRAIGCRAPLGGSDPIVGFEKVTDRWAEAVSDADFISLHIPLRPETAHYVNSLRLAQVPHRAWLINTSRGGVVDERALYEALKNDRLAGAALDVFEREPYRPSGPFCDLRELPNVVMTPHIGSSTVEACRRVAERCLFNIRAAAECRWSEMDLLNPDVLNALSLREAHR